MKNLVLLSILVVAASTACSAGEHVNGYTRSDGTHVNGYERTSPNGTTSDNYSHSGNVNPYTGQPGDKNN